MSDPYLITVYCQDESHAERRWDINVFYANDDNHWVSPMAPIVAGSRRARQLLKGTEPKAFHPSRVYGREADVRVRYKLRCKLCGLSKELRDERLQVALSALAAAGQTEVSLSVLVASM